jgi:hypothetical protein
VPSSHTPKKNLLYHAVTMVAISWRNPELMKFEKVVITVFNDPLSDKLIKHDLKMRHKIRIHNNYHSNVSCKNKGKCF